MLVKAIKKGYYLKERHEGDQFNFPDRDLKRDKEGKPVMPTWFVPVPDSERPKPPSVDTKKNTHGKVVDNSKTGDADQI